MFTTCAASDNGILLTANGATDEVSLCPGVVQFTCTAINLAKWKSQVVS